MLLTCFFTLFQHVTDFDRRCPAVRPIRPSNCPICPPACPEGQICCPNGCPGSSNCISIPG